MPLAGLIRGAACVFRGAVLVTRPGVRHYAYIPLIINVLVFAALIWVSGEAFDSLLDRYLAGTEGILWSLLRWVMWALFSAALVLVSFFTFTLAANLIGSPFNEALSAAVAGELARRPVESGQSWTALLAAFPAAIGQEIVKWLYFARWLLPALVLFVIPGVQVLAPFVWAWLAAWFLALEYLEYPASNQNLDFAALRQRAKSHRGYLWGFGATVFALALIPGLNLILMPVAVAGATVLWVQYMRDDQQVSQYSG